jgi:REP element-mobilizing transposase RayT
VPFSPAEIRVVAAAFAEMVAAADILIHACAILPNHMHVVMARGGNSYERTINRLKGRSAQRIREARGWSCAARRRERVAVWTQGYWSRYIDHPAQMERAIAYVRANPVRGGLPPQRWGFVDSDV